MGKLGVGAHESAQNVHMYCNEAILLSHYNAAREFELVRELAQKPREK